MIDAIWIGIWAWLFCRPLSEDGAVFGRLRGLVYVSVFTKSRLSQANSEMLYKALIDCPKCHAGQVAFWWQVVAFIRGDGFSIPFVLAAILTAFLFENIDEIMEKYKNS
jgi:hypothetical protein